MCGIVITHEEGRISSIKGDTAHPLSRGYICPKATALQDIHNDPDRLRFPILKTAQGWERISWDNAFNEVAGHIRNLQAKYGFNSIATYAGNPTVHSLGTMLGWPMLVAALKTENNYSATSLDQLAHMLVSLKLYGNQLLLPVPDIDRTDFLLCVGANPIASNGSLMGAPDFKKKVQALRNRGGKLVVIDPRRTETAAIADQHHFIQPGTDALLLMAMINTLFREQLVRLGKTETFLRGVNFLRNCVAEFTPARVADRTGIPAEVIHELAIAFAAAPTAVVYGRVGTSTQAFGTLATWLINVLNILTGRLDTEGGVMFTRPAVDLVGLAMLAGKTGDFGLRRSRVRKLPAFSGEFPTSTLADEILTEGDGQIRALITCAGNPVLSAPNGTKLERALKALDYMVCIDFYLNETTQHANIILPPTGPLERSHYDLALNLLATHNYANYSPPLYQPLPDSRHDWQIMWELVRRIETKGPLGWAAAQAKHRLLSTLKPEGILDLLLRAGPYGVQLPGPQKLQKALVDALYKRLPANSLARTALDISAVSRSLSQSAGATGDLPQGLSLDALRKAPHGLDLGPLQPCLPERLATSGKLINIAPKTFLNEISKLQQALRKPATRSADVFTLIGRRQIRSNNSWMHNCHRLVKGREECIALMHPDDAKRLLIQTGDTIVVSSRVGEIQLPVRLTTDILPRVISIPHGWGHHRNGSQLEVAQAHPGVSINDITDDQYLDTLTGGAAFNGQQVTVSPLRAGDNIVRISDRRLELDEGH
ncbi:Probable molybdopterin oxidoreductase [gamma proteobacterium HdN1]|nr:Probable molybdopterin oxidoreductase [gamma proteobacterium HdN1]